MRTRVQRSFRLALLALTLGGVMLSLAPSPFSPAFVWNVTRSAPPGVYRLHATGWTKGDRVAAKPDGRLLDQLISSQILEEGKLLIKRVAATEGDIVCREGEVVTINGAPVVHAARRTSEGATLPVWLGCIRLSRGEVFLLGDGDSSFDGRYFGVTPARQIVGRVEIVANM